MPSDREEENLSKGYEYTLPEKQRDHIKSLLEQLLSLLRSKDEGLPQFAVTYSAAPDYAFEGFGCCVAIDEVALLWAMHLPEKAQIARTVIEQMIVAGLADCKGINRFDESVFLRAATAQLKTYLKLKHRDTTFVFGLNLDQPFEWDAVIDGCEASVLGHAVEELPGFCEHKFPVNHRKSNAHLVVRVKREHPILASGRARRVLNLIRAGVNVYCCSDDHIENDETFRPRSVFPEALWCMSISQPRPPSVSYLAPVGDLPAQARRIESGLDIFRRRLEHLLKRPNVPAWQQRVRSSLLNAQMGMDARSVTDQFFGVWRGLEILVSGDRIRTEDVAKRASVLTKDEVPLELVMSLASCRNALAHKGEFPVQGSTAVSIMLRTYLAALEEFSRVAPALQSSGALTKYLVLGLAPQSDIDDTSKALTLLRTV